MAEQPATQQPRQWPKNFADRRKERMPSFFRGIRAVLSGEIRGDISRAHLIPVAPAPLPTVADDDVSVTWVGHASFVVRIGGLTVLTDPVWSRRIPGVKARLTPVGVPWEAVGHVDAVVISHNHYDHLDAPTIKMLPRETAIFVPAKLAAWFSKRGFTNVTELDWWEGVDLDGVRFDFVPAHHWSRRGPFDFCATLWGGWILTAGSNRLYFAGDTGYGDWFTQIGARYPDIDLALMPIGAFEPRWFMKPSHVNPAEAVQACIDVGARRMVPMHWGTFLLSAEPVLSPPQLAAESWATADRPAEDLWTLAIGESKVLSKTPAKVQD